jgi:hypothetical protein
MNWPEKIAVRQGNCFQTENCLILVSNPFRIPQDGAKTKSLDI